MSAREKTTGESRWNRTRARVVQESSRFVRLAQLRKLRECEQVAAVCYRVRRRGIEFLLVQTRGSGRWTFPKGSVEPGLTHAQAAALEAFEEAGVHGRIEETSFAQYALRKRGDARKSGSKSAEKEFAVSAHLCEVLRLANPEESNRDRTWFSVKDTRRRLREGRESADGIAFGRVVDRAVARIWRLRRGNAIVNQRKQQVRTQTDAPPKDALQKVQFDFAEARRWMQMPNIYSQASETQKLAAPVVEAHSREIMQCDVLQFDRPREFNRSPKYLSHGKKPKALGTGTRNG